MWELICRLIVREFEHPHRAKDSGAAVIVLKAFPLEYEGTTTAENERAFEHRRLALMRLYSKRLGVTPLSGSAEADGWMYRLVHAPLPPRVARGAGKSRTQTVKGKNMSTAEHTPMLTREMKPNRAGSRFRRDPASIEAFGDQSLRSSATRVPDQIATFRGRS